MPALTDQGTSAAEHLENPAAMLKQAEHAPAKLGHLYHMLTYIDECFKHHAEALKARDEQLRALEARIAEMTKDAQLTATAFVDGSSKMRARIEALEARPALKYLGVWTPGKYEQGHCVTLAGSVWIAKEPTSAKPGDGATSWQLAVKAGRDGKDLRGGQP